MSIPKVIHYCWFGGNPLPTSATKCIESWKKYCPDYEIIQWNERNYDLASAPLYVRQAYEAKKWAFVTDYIRLEIVYQHGGIYLDTDVEVIRSLDPLLRHDCFIGRQPGFQVNTGSGFGAVKGHPLLKIMLDDYQDIPFIKENGEMDLWTCPHRNSQWLFEHGLRYDDSYQELAGAAIYPIEYFSPKDAYTRVISKTKNTYSIHHCDGSWNPNETKQVHAKRYLIHQMKNAIDYTIHIPNRVVRSILGKEKYEALKAIRKR